MERLSKKAFCCDPLMGEDYSRVTSVVSSAYKRHGQILEASILNCLQAYDKFAVWNDPKLHIPQAAEALAGTYMGTPAAALAANITHEGPGDRTVQVDLLVYDKEQNTVCSYEVKRGAGTHDAGKRRSMLRDLLCTQVVLKSYGDHQLDVQCASAHSHVIIYYGAETLGAPFTLTRDDMDDHFGVPIVEQVEEVNAYYRSRVEELLESQPGQAQQL